MSALDISPSARNNARLAQNINAASRAVEGITHRVFYPEIATRKFRAPVISKLWLNQHELITSLDLISGDVTLVENTDFFLEPQASGPPYNAVDLNTGADGAWNWDSTPQQSISIRGLWGYNLETAPVGDLVSSINDSVTTLDVTRSPGVGSLLTIGTERLIVTDCTWLSSGQALQASLAAQANVVSVSVTDGTAFVANEVILIDSERMLVTDVAGNALTVKRAVEGSVLAAHTTGTIYVPRRLSVSRGVLGTTAASHTAGDDITRHVYPGLIVELTIAIALTYFEQGKSGYAREVGAGDNRREASGRGVRDITAEAIRTYGRQGRMRSV